MPVRLTWKLPILVLAAAGAACDDSLGPRTWDATPDTAVLYSLSRVELLGRPSAYDFVQLVRVAIEEPGATGAWDIALGEEGDAFVVIPSSAFPGISSRAGVGETTNQTLAELTRAPGDSASYSQRPVRVRQGAVYVVRTRREQCIGFGAGVRYAKFQVISIDPAAGTVRIAAVRNPYCNDRALVPPDES
jgi:hypothetical protein